MGRRAWNILVTIRISPWVRSISLKIVLIVENLMVGSMVDSMVGSMVGSIPPAEY